MRDLFLFAHQDDEFGAFALIEAAVVAGRRPLCVFLTNGNLNGLNSAQRDAESRAVLVTLGVSIKDIVFLGGDESIADGSLPNHLVRAYIALEQCVAEEGIFEILYVVGYEGGHQDHDAACALAVALQKRGRVRRLRQFPLYNGAGLVGPLFRVLSPLAANGEVSIICYGLRKRVTYILHCLRYPSQWKTWVGLLPFVALHQLLSGRQSSQPLNPDRLEEPPHAGPPLYERRGFYLESNLRARSASFLSMLPPNTERTTLSDSMRP